VNIYKNRHFSMAIFCICIAELFAIKYLQKDCYYCMKTVAELKQMRDNIANSNDHAVVVVAKTDILALIDQTIEQQTIINRWFGFMRYMAQRSSWSRQIGIVLNEYLYGTSDADVKNAAQHYLQRLKIHGLSVDTDSLE